MPDISLVPVDHDPFAAMSDQDYYNASVAAGAQGGEGVPLTIQPGESAGGVQGPNQPSSEYATMKPYEPTIREKLIAALAGTSKERPSAERQRVAEGLANVVGLTPVGIPMAAQEMRRDADTGHYLGATLNAMAMIPAANIGAKVAAAGVRSAPYTRQLNDIGLYSHAAETAAGLPQAVGTPEQFKAMLLKNGVKPAEIEAAGFDAAMAGVPKVTREDVTGLFEGAVPKLEERVLGFKPDNVQAARSIAESQGHNWDELSAVTQGRYIRRADGRRITDYGGDPKFQQYTLPGGENYREVLLKAPGRKSIHNELQRKAGVEGRLSHLTPEQIDEAFKVKTAPDFKSSHWDDPNVVAHLRMSDRTNNGEKVLHLEELQSDWGQSYRKTSGENTPSGPYVTKTQDWTDLGLKRALKEAAEGGYDRLTWTPGVEQAKRYDLSKSVNYIDYVKEPDGKFRLAIVDKNDEGMALPKETYSRSELADLVGKEVADKIANGEGKTGGGRTTLSGIDLQVGGEGMKSYYDKIVPTRLKEIIKKLNPEAKIEPHNIRTISKDAAKIRGMSDDEARRLAADPLHGRGVPTLSIRITPKMKEAIKKGLPAFAIGGGIGLGAANNYSLTPVDHDPFQVNISKRGI